MTWVPTTRLRWMGVISIGTAVFVASLVGCGDDTQRTATEETSERPVVEALEVVDALEVEVVGELDADEREIVDWALGRFSEAELLLRPVIEVCFHQTQEPCLGGAGKCVDPQAALPSVHVCEPGGDTAFRTLNRRMTLLHELAHIWYRSSADYHVFDDLAAIVGGTASNSPDIPWQDRSEERLATAITWGLLDQVRRPVQSEFTCAQLYTQFVALTGHAPLGFLEPSCIPDIATG